jgi:hypothetical protein
MGRAIDMENDIDALKIKVKRLENQLRGMVSKIDDLEEDVDEIYEGSGKTKHVDLVEEVGAETESIDVKKEDKKADNEGNGKGDKSSNKSGGKSKSKTK